MSDRVHIIEIDRIILTGVEQSRPGQLTALITAEMLRVLAGARLHTPPAIANSEMRIAGEVARTVVRSVQGGSNGF
jgi:hypothetical protein